MTIATSAQQTVVRAGLMQEEEYIGETIRLVGFDGKAVVAPLASVWLYVH